MSDTSQQQSRLKELIARGKEQGYLTYAEVNDHLPEDIADPDQVEDIIRMINDMGISVSEVAPDAETLLMTEGDSVEDADDEAVAALAAVESDAGRTTDPVRMYMREMGTVELLTREGEIEIAKRIEEGIREVMMALSYFPGSVEAILAAYDATLQEEGRLSDIFSGYIDPDAPIPEDEIDIDELDEDDDDADSDDDDEDGDDDDSSDDEKDRGPDPEEAAQRFGLIRQCLEAYIAALEAHGNTSPEAQAALEELSIAFSPIKLSPRFYEMLVSRIRSFVERIRTQERTIMRICTQRAGMPRKDFIQSFPGNETNPDWFDSLAAGKQSWAEKIGQ
ncbi:MAG: RNA polymerase sigma factor RpoD, partial [Oceanospirillales bacterium]